MPDIYLSTLDSDQLRARIAECAKSFNDTPKSHVAARAYWSARYTEASDELGRITTPRPPVKRRAM